MLFSAVPAWDKLWCRSGIPCRRFDLFAPHHGSFQLLLQGRGQHSRSTRYILLYQYKSLLASLTIIPCSPGTGPEHLAQGPLF
jgi:hypothetical protein